MSLFSKPKTEPKKKDTTKPQDAKADLKDAKKEPASMKDLYEGKTEGKSKGAKATSSKRKSYSEAYRTLVKPLITEKAATLNSDNKYVFMVANDANKIMVARSIESVYGVKPKQINIISVKGKKTRTGRISGKRKDWKKAIVTLPKGKSIQIYEGV